MISISSTTKGSFDRFRSAVGLSQLCYQVTEHYFLEHPEEYHRHPAMFLGQVSTDDVQADGCAALYYHEACQQHNVTSELHLVPLEEQRCYCVGTPGAAGVTPVRRHACSSCCCCSS